MSIRYWHPTIPIKLIKDELHGKFDTSEFEKVLNISVLETESRAFGWCFGKLEPFFLTDKHRFLILDADIIFVGPVIDLLEQYDQDFVVRYEEPPDLAFVDKFYFVLEHLKQFDPKFQFPGFTFNGGGIVATTGIFKRSDFDRFVRWTTPPQFSLPELFKCGDQGVLNYLFMTKQAQGEISLARCDFMDFAYTPGGAAIELDKLDKNSPYTILLHWAGPFKHPVSPHFDNTPRADLLMHFEKLYYDLIPFGAFRRWTRLWLVQLYAAVKSCAKKIPGLVTVGRRLKKISAS